MRTIHELDRRSFTTLLAHEIAIGDRLIEGTVAAIDHAASPKGKVVFTFTDGKTAEYGYAGAVIVLLGSVTGMVA